MTAAGAAAFAGGQWQGQPDVKVVGGEKLTGLQAPQAMLIPSGTTTASLLAHPGWAARGTPASAVMTGQGGHGGWPVPRPR